MWLLTVLEKAYAGVSHTHSLHSWSTTALNTVSWNDKQRNDDAELSAVGEGNKHTQHDQTKCLAIIHTVQYCCIVRIMYYTALQRQDLQLKCDCLHVS